MDLGDQPDHGALKIHTDRIGFDPDDCPGLSEAWAQIDSGEHLAAAEEHSVVAASSATNVGFDREKIDGIRVNKKHGRDWEVEIVADDGLSPQTIEEIEREGGTFEDRGMTARIPVSPRRGADLDAVLESEGVARTRFGLTRSGLAPWFVANGDAQDVKLAAGGVFDRHEDTAITIRNTWAEGWTGDPQKLPARPGVKEATQALRRMPDEDSRSGLAAAAQDGASEEDRELASDVLRDHVMRAKIAHGPVDETMRDLYDDATVGDYPHRFKAYLRLHEALETRS